MRIVKNGDVHVSAPIGMPKKEVERFIEEHREWIALADMKELTGISVTAIQKLLDQLIHKKYVERGEKDGSWRVFVTQ
jgi:DNA-binding IclR family transcriptional regulator